jgi:hypothetical protein
VCGRLLANSRKPWGLIPSHLPFPWYVYLLVVNNVNAKKMIVMTVLVLTGMVGMSVPAQAATPQSDVALPPAVQQLLDEFNAAPDGATVFENVANGIDVSVVKINGRAVVESHPVAPTSTGSDDDIVVQADGFCTWAVTAAVLGLGAVTLAALAASGGAEIAGVFIAPELLKDLSMAVGGAGSVEGLVGAYVC